MGLCSVCGKEFVWLSRLKEHVLFTHLHIYKKNEPVDKLKLHDKQSGDPAGLNRTSTGVGYSVNCIEKINPEASFAEHFNQTYVKIIKDVGKVSCNDCGEEY